MRAGAVARGVLVGALAVVTAVLVGVAIAWLLAALGLTETDTLRLGSWLAGLGLLGGWRQTVTSDVAGGLEWSTWAAGAPLLITGAAAVVLAVPLRRMRVGLAGVAGAGLGAGGAAAALVALSQRTLTTTNEAGTVDVTEGLTWWWTGGLRPGTVTGAAALAVLVGLVSTVGAPWWRGGRAVAYGLVVVPGLLITLIAAARRRVVDELNGCRASPWPCSTHCSEAPCCSPWAGRPARAGSRGSPLSPTCCRPGPPGC